ncbi:hypothetical protein Lalb_Chr07g0187681 [Lupinus albus]|uniref:Uncharacterized protein n=1 Tax=Lupinus albus TaxID=3870 RepID=A0A6A4QAD8_LUPAL|nr:hypothetical protein Lalb_Chr07g0187681 [Lupinus albus]
MGRLKRKCHLLSNSISLSYTFHLNIMTRAIRVSFRIHTSLS